MLNGTDSINRVDAAGTEAACWTAVNEGRAVPDDWFPDAGKLNRDNRRAVAICHECGLKARCMRWALKRTAEHHAFGGIQGIWGGTTASDRDRIMRRLA